MTTDYQPKKGDRVAVLEWRGEAQRLVATRISTVVRDSARIKLEDGSEWSRGRRGIGWKHYGFAGTYTIRLATPEDERDVAEAAEKERAEEAARWAEADAADRRRDRRKRLEAAIWEADDATLDRVEAALAVPS